MIYHITHKKDWDKAITENSYKPESLEKEGFIHCSPAGKITDTANNFFKNQKDLVLIWIDETKVNCKIIWEDLYGQDFKFPHIYGELNPDAVIKVTEFTTGSDGNFVLPEGI